MHPCAQNLNVAVFAFLEIVLDHFHERLGRRNGVGHHERQFKHLGARITTGGITDNGHGDVGHAVDGLVHQFRRFAAKSHGIKMLNRDRTARGFLDLLGPRFQDVLGHGRHRRQELVQAQGHVRGPCRTDRQSRCTSSTRKCADKVTSFHSFLPLVRASQPANFWIKARLVQQNRQITRPSKPKPIERNCTGVWQGHIRKTIK